MAEINRNKLLVFLDYSVLPINLDSIRVNLIAELDNLKVYFRQHPCPLNGVLGWVL